MGRLLTGLCIFAAALATISCGDNKPAENARRNAPDPVPVEEDHQSVDLTVRLFPFSAGRGKGRNKWGYMDREGNEIIPPRFSTARDFWEGLAYAVHLEQDRSSNDFFINERGERVFTLPSDCYAVRSFSDGMAAFNLDMDFKWGFVDREGNVVIEPKYDKVDYFHEGVACVCVNMSEDSQTGELYDGDWGYVDKTGHEVIKPQFSGAQGFSDGLAWVHIDGSDATYIDKSGKVALRVARERVRFGPTPFHEGLASFRASKESGFGFIDKTGKFVIEPTFASVESFSEGLAAVALQTGQDQYKWGYIDRTGGLVLNADYDEVSRFTEGRAAVRVGEFWGIIDKRGNYVVKPGESPTGVTGPINEVRDFRGGLTCVHVGGKREPDQFGEHDPYGDWVGGAWYYMNRAGRIVRQYCKDWEGSPY